MAEEIIEIELHRGETGLGFNVKGGTDQLVEGDCGIFVAKLNRNGAAAEDGRLRKGDKILQVNDFTLENVQHDEAVNFFRKAGSDIKLRVQPGLEQRLKEQKAAAKRHREQLSAEAGGRSQGGISATKLVLGIGVLALIGYGSYRYRHHLS